MNYPTPRYVAYFALLGILSLSSACLEHGEDDPWLSFTTRNGRLVRFWELQTYSLESDDKVSITTIFNNTACDTSDIGGISIDNFSREEALADTILNATVSYTQSSNNETKIYNVKMTYFLDIHDNSTYTCNGSYAYNDAELDAEVTGTFQAHNSWYWETGMKTDWAVTFFQFPVIDGSAIAETGQPLRYIPAQTFDLRELREHNLQLEAETGLSNSVEQHILPYTIIGTLDTIFNCERTITTETDKSSLQNWTFIHKEEE